MTSIKDLARCCFYLSLPQQEHLSGPMRSGLIITLFSQHQLVQVICEWHKTENRFAEEMTEL